MVFQLDFKGPYHNIRMHLGNVLVVCDLYGLYLSAFKRLFCQKGEAFLSYFGLHVL